MLGVGIDGMNVIMVVMIMVVVVVMMMSVVIVMVVIMIVVVVMIMVMMIMIERLQATHPGAEGIAQPAIRDIGPRRIRALPLDVMMVAFLHRAHLGLEAQNGGAVFAQNTGRRRDRPEGGVVAVLRCGQSGALVRGDLTCLPIIGSQNLHAILTGAAVGGRRGAVLL